MCVRVRVCVEHAFASRLLHLNSNAGPCCLASATVISVGSDDPSRVMLDTMQLTQ